MIPNFENQFFEIIQDDTWMMDKVKLVKDLDLNDSWIAAGFVRNKIWDVLHNKARTELNDVDVIYFDPSNNSIERDKALEEKLRDSDPIVKWSVKNQTRMHLRNGHIPYADCLDAIAVWPETATSIAVRLNADNQIEYIAPYGLDDLFNLIVRPTPGFNPDIYHRRIQEKGWKEKWGHLNIIMSRSEE